VIENTINSTLGYGLGLVLRLGLALGLALPLPLGLGLGHKGCSITVACRIDAPTK
jgi:hypothetical protein